MFVPVRAFVCLFGFVVCLRVSARARPVLGGWAISCNPFQSVHCCGCGGDPTSGIPRVEISPSEIPRARRNGVFVLFFVTAGGGETTSSGVACAFNYRATLSGRRGY